LPFPDRSPPRYRHPMTEANPTPVSDARQTGLYGAPPAEVARAPEGAIQFSPLMPGAQALEDAAPGTLSQMVMLAPPGTVERRYAVALALRALAPGAVLTLCAPKDQGGLRLRKELTAFGCEPQETVRRHHRICTVRRPDTIAELDAAIAEGAPRLVEQLGLWSQPGVFSWDRIDPGTALLVEQLPAADRPLSGKGADFGCGLGVLAHSVLRSPQVEGLTMIDIDRRAIAAAQRNVVDPRVRFMWADVRLPDATLTDLNFVVMNPPFHDGGNEDRALGQTFIRRAADVLRKGGVCWITANRHLPYEAILTPLFKRVALRAEANGYKVYEAQK
jgi:16S rRNA (guanine1207-N2)-methyltransferase